MITLSSRDHVWSITKTWLNQFTLPGYVGHRLECSRCGAIALQSLEGRIECSVISKKQPWLSSSPCYGERINDCQGN